jgi:hypothetical protein
MDNQEYIQLLQEIDEMDELLEAQELSAWVVKCKTPECIVFYNYINGEVRMIDSKYINQLFVKEGD